ncbi:MAG: hypothetical protein JWR56_2220 [Massilia sp.]|nr:hypothetical protein [Massilia sp.]
MNATVTKVKTNLAEDSRRFEFSAESVIPSRKGLKLIITSAGGPIAQIQATLFDINDIARDAIGVPDHGAPFSTGDTGKAEWDFSAAECAGGYLKWRIWPVVSGAGLRTYHITEAIEENGITLCKTTVTGTIADGAIVDTPFLDGVQIAGSAR